MSAHHHQVMEVKMKVEKVIKIVVMIEIRSGRVSLVAQKVCTGETELFYGMLF